MDVLDGGGGDDTLEGGIGADTLGGGLDDDRYVIDAADTVLEFGGEGFDTIEVGSSWTLANQFEGLVLGGGANLNGTGNGASNAITGNGGVNRLIGAAGNDTLDGGAGVDSLTGGIGDDVYYVDSDDDSVIETANGGTHRDHHVCDGDPGQCRGAAADGRRGSGVTGNTGANRLQGNTGANTLDGKAGADTMAGGAGNDTYVSDGLDQISAGWWRGSTSCRPTSASWAGELEYLKLAAWPVARHRQRSRQHDHRQHRANTLDGGAGADTLTGAAGNDTYVIDAEDTIVEFPGAGNDTGAPRSASRWRPISRTWILPAPPVPMAPATRMPMRSPAMPATTCSMCGRCGHAERRRGRRPSPLFSPASMPAIS